MNFDPDGENRQTPLANLPFILIHNVHGRLLNVVEVKADDSDVDTARGNSFWHFSCSSISSLGIVDLRVLDVLVLLAFQNSHTFVECHPDFGLVKSSGGTGDADGFV